MKPTIILTLLLLLVSPFRADACTIFSMVEGDKVYVGNNEDWYIPHPRYRILPGNEGTYGRIIFSYANNWGQGGMNEKGLFFDWILQPGASSNWKEDPAKENLYGNLSEKILAECASVEEALKYYEAYNEPIFETSYIALIDTSGETVFVSWEEGGLEITRCKGICISGYGGEKIVEAHKGMTGPMDKSKMVRLLDAGHQVGEFPTLYSNVYDLKKGQVHLFYYHNYQEEVVLDLQEELKKGAQTVELADIFSAKMPAAKIKELRRKYFFEEVKTIPLKGWLVVGLILGAGLLLSAWGIQQLRRVF